MDNELKELRQAVQTLIDCQSFMDVCDDKDQFYMYFRLTRGEYQKYRIAVAILDAAMELNS